MYLVIFTILILVLFGTLGLRYKSADSLPLYVLYAQGYFSITVLVLLDINSKAELFYVYLIILSMMSYVLSITFFSRLIQMKPAHKFETITIPYGERRKIAMLFFLSMVITYLYYNLAGYNLFLSLIRGNLIDDFTTMRLALYSSKTFSGAGIVNQFKNVILPCSIYVLTILVYQSKRISFLLKLTAYSIAIFILLWALLGTGQRAPLIYVFIGFMFSTALLGKFKAKYFVLPIALVVILFMLFTILNGRAENSNLTALLSALIERAIFNDQYEGIISFMYIYERPLSSFEDWFLDVRGLLPAFKGSPLTHDIFASIHGNSRGMAGIPTLVSVYHNGGILFVPIFYIFYGFITVLIQYRLRAGGKSVFRFALYGSVYMLFVLFFTGAPVSLLNKGLLGVIFATVIIKYSINQRSSRFCN